MKLTAIFWQNGFVFGIASCDWRTRNLHEVARLPMCGTEGNMKRLLRSKSRKKLKEHPIMYLLCDDVIDRTTDQVV
jgi:hypothetical protein